MLKQKNYPGERLYGSSNVIRELKSDDEGDEDVDMIHGSTKVSGTNGGGPSAMTVRPYQLLSPVQHHTEALSSNKQPSQKKATTVSPSSATLEQLL